MTGGAARDRFSAEPARAPVERGGEGAMTSNRNSALNDQSNEADTRGGITRPRGFMLFLVLLVACSASSKSDDPGQRYRTFLLGRDDQVAVRIKMFNKGLGTTPESLNVSFDKDDLRQFLKLERLPLSDQAMALLDRRDCHSDGGLAPFSVRIEGGLDHAIRILENRYAEGYHRDDNNPTIRHGLVDKGPTHWAGDHPSMSHELFLPNQDRPYGMEFRCGVSELGALLNCTVWRDVHKQVAIQYHICSDLLPHIHELDGLYFDLLEKIVIRPRLTSNYRLRN